MMTLGCSCSATARSLLRPPSCSTILSGVPSRSTIMLRSCSDLALGEMSAIFMSLPYSLAAYCIAIGILPHDFPWQVCGEARHRQGRLRGEPERGEPLVVESDD